MSRYINDPVWKDIFDSLVIENNPPAKYIREVQVITNTGDKYTISPEEFTDLLESEKNHEIPPNSIVSCRLRIDFNRIKRDVNRWSKKLLEEMDTMQIETAPSKKTKKTASK